MTHRQRTPGSSTTPARPPGRRRLAVAAIAAALALVLAACEVDDPAANTIVPTNWGANLRPTQADVLYLPGGRTGCPGQLTPDSPCGGAHNLDIYPATQGGSLGTFMWIHGGGFSGGDKYPLTDQGPIRRLTHLGWSVVSVNYRLASQPDGRFPAGAQDVHAALRWVRVNGMDRGLNTQRIVVAGESAGGTLAALAGTTANAGSPLFPEVPPVSGWVAVAGILDFDAGPMSQFWSSVWLASATQRTVASPVTWWDPADPQGWIIHGDLDDVVEYANTNRLLARAAASGRVQRDTVDRFATGEFQPLAARGHTSVRGMNSDALVAWMAELPTLDGTANPVGSLDVARTSNAGSVAVGGWALDPDTPAPITVHLVVDGTFHSATVATTGRPDIAAAYPLHGPDHGFAATIDGLPAGTRRVCAAAVNARWGTGDTWLGCRTVVVSAP